MIDLVKNPRIFGGKIPWVTLSRSDPDYRNDDGNYWRGAVWLPTAYMSIKALEKYGYHKLVDKTPDNLVKHMLRTHRDYSPHTIWECYSPSRPEPAKHRGRRVRPDFCGWSALGPISLLIENILGFHNVDAANKKIEWRLHQKGRHGVTHFRFGDIVTDIVFDGKKTIAVQSNKPYTLIVNGHSHEVALGDTTITLF